MNMFSKKAQLAAFCMAAALAWGALAQAAENDGRVLTQSPSTDGAYIAKMPGFVNNQKIKLLDGSRKAIDDGVVIRKSEVRDGKVIIPPSGLYTTSRCSNFHPFNDHTMTVAGKPYHFITDNYEQNVVKNVTMKPGETVWANPEKSKAWLLKSIDAKPFGIDGAHMAYFNLVKATGNNYGNPFIVTAGENVTPSASDGSFEKSAAASAAATIPDSAQRDILPQIVGNNVATNARSSVTVDSVSPKEAKIREFVTITTTNASISPDAPVVDVYGKGDTFPLDSAVVEVLEVTPESATVKITDGKDSVTKTLKADKESLRQFPASRPVIEDMMVRTGDGTKIVNLNPRNEGGVFSGGKVALMGHKNVINFRGGDKWPADTRFIVRPET